MFDMGDRPHLGMSSGLVSTTAVVGALPYRMTKVRSRTLGSFLRPTSQASRCCRVLSRLLFCALARTGC